MEDYYRSDEEQLEIVKKWWNDYGKFIIIAIIIGIVVGFAWRYWRQHELQKAAQASALYQTMGTFLAQNNQQQAQVYATQLLNQYQESPYASLAALWQAQQFVLEKKLPQAYQQLQWVMQNSRQATLQQIARIRAARILLAQHQFDMALQILATVKDVAFAPLIELTRGDIYLAQRNIVQARIAYLQVKNALLLLGVSDPLINMKLANLTIHSS